MEDIRLEISNVLPQICQRLGLRDGFMMHHQDLNEKKCSRGP